MGYVTTPTFRVVFSGVTADDRPVHHTPSGWDTKRAGRPTDANLALYVEALEASTRPGGCNDHLGATIVGAARIVRQSNDEIVASYQAAPARPLVAAGAAMFQVVA